MCLCKCLLGKYKLKVYWLLLPAFWRNGEGNVFTPVCQPVHTWGVPHLADGEGGYPHLADGGYPIWLMRSMPIQPTGRGGVLPSGWWGVPHLADRGVSPSGQWECTSPAIGQIGVFPLRLDGGKLPPPPHQDRMGVTPHQDWMGVRTPLSGQDGVPPPPSELDGSPPPPRQQHREHLLHGRQYASCVHAGGLFCYC